MILPVAVEYHSWENQHYNTCTANYIIEFFIFSCFEAIQLSVAFCKGNLVKTKCFIVQFHQLICCRQEVESALTFVFHTNSLGDNTLKQYFKSNNL